MAPGIVLGRSSIPIMNKMWPLPSRSLHSPDSSSLKALSKLINVTQGHLLVIATKTKVL